MEAAANGEARNSVNGLSSYQQTQALSSQLTVLLVRIYAARRELALPLAAEHRPARCAAAALCAAQGYASEI